MADDIRIEITGDLKGLKRELKKARGALRRFESVNEQATQRRARRENATEKQITAAAARETQKRLKQEQRLFKKRARARLRSIKARIREEKQVARAQERVLKRHAKRRQAIMRKAGTFARYGLAAAGAVAFFKGREILRFDESLARIAAQANITEKEQLKLRDSLTKTAVEYGVNRNVLLETTKTIVDLSGDIDLASGGMVKFAKIIRGTGADASELGRFAVSLKAAFGDITDAELFDYMEILIAQGDKAKVNIAAMASEGEKLFGAFRGKGFEGRKSFIEFGAFVQLAARSGDVAEGATAVTRFLDSLIARQKQLGEAGVEIFTGKGKQKKIRDFGDILKDILKATGGDVTKMKALFPNIRALKAIELMGIEYKKSGGELKNFNDLFDVGATAADNIGKKYKRVAETSSQGFKRMGAAFTFLTDKALVGAMNDISDAFIRIIDDPSKLKQLEDTFKIIGDTLRLLLKAPKFARDIGIKIAKLTGADKPTKELTRLKMEIERQRLAGIEKKTPEQLEALKNITFKIENNLITDRPLSLKSESILDMQANTERGGVEETRRLVAGGRGRAYGL